MVPVAPVEAGLARLAFAHVAPRPRFAVVPGRRTEFMEGPFKVGIMSAAAWYSEAMGGPDWVGPFLGHILKQGWCYGKYLTRNSWTDTG